LSLGNKKNTKFIWGHWKKHSFLSRVFKLEQKKHKHPYFWIFYAFYFIIKFKKPYFILFNLIILFRFTVKIDNAPCICMLIKPDDIATS